MSGQYQGYELRLTGLAISEIADHMDPDKEDTLLNVYLTGFLLCKLMEFGEYDVINEDYFDNELDQDQFSCMSTYLSRYGIGNDQIEGLTDFSYLNGYLTYEPVPFIGRINIYGPNREILSESNRERIDHSRVRYNYLETETFYQEHVFSFINDYIFFYSSGLSWNQLIYVLSRARIDQETILNEELMLIYMEFEKVISNNIESVITEKIKYFITDEYMNPIGMYISF